MTLTPQFLDELRHRTLLSALIGRTTKLQKAGREFRACCPFHNEKSPSFYVNDDKGFYHCFGCGAHGDAIRWMTDNRGLPFIDAVKELVQAAGMEMPAQDRQSAERAERAKGLHEAMADAAAWFTDQLNGIAGAEARSVLEKRGIKAETARTFGLGFAPDSRGKLKDALKTYGDPMLVEAGLLIAVEEKTPYDRFRGRLMIPIRDPRGRPVAFGGRIIGDGEPKYLNSPETPLFDKGRTLYNLDRALPAARQTGRIIVVEGYMDVIALAQAGFGEAVAPLGTALTEHQLDRLWRIADVPILCFDGDAAGQKAAMRAATRALPMLAPGRSLCFVTIPDGQDPDDLVRAKGPAAFEALLGNTEPLVDRLWKNELAAGGQLRTPEERAALGSRLRARAKEIQDEHLRSEYLATFNRMVWDYFHPERPSESFKRFKSESSKLKPVNPRMLAISQYGIDQAAIIPALFKGLLRYPEMISPLAETLDQISVNATALRQTREAMFMAALDYPKLETGQLSAILRDEGLHKVLDRFQRVTLAFSFLVNQGDPEAAKHDLSLVAERLAIGPRIDLEISEARAKSDGWSDTDYSDFVTLVTTQKQMEQAFQDALLEDTTA